MHLFNSIIKMLTNTVKGKGYPDERGKNWKMKYYKDMFVLIRLEILVLQHK